ncbi:MAG TPA: hypothetical protein PKW56_00570 [Clostridiales bacterium]|nr:hypothetical protein [Clostridiales bacterium]
MDKLSKLIRLEIYVLRNDPKVRIKLMISFLLIIYVLSFSFVESEANILPFFWFGFFFASPLIDYCFYVERLNRRFLLLIGKGFTLRQIITAKSLVIFTTGLISGILFTSAALLLNNSGFLNADLTDNFFIYLTVISLYNYFIIVFSGVLQTRFEIIFPVRLLNILGFIIFVNFQDRMAEFWLRYFYNVQITVLLALITLTTYLSGILNKDKIS